jgi:HAD superfamily hydrolase (TIGR01509 family)
MKNAKLKVKGIMFDLDGTILDTKPAYVEAAKITFRSMGQTIPENDVLLQIPKRLEQKQSIADIVKMDTQKFLDLYLKTFYRIAKNETKPVPCVSETLNLLSQKAKLAVITMRFMPKETIFEELRQYQLDGYFAHIVTALDTRKPKPSPEALIKAVEAMDVQMCDCMIVGDSVVDVKAGKAAGAKTVAVLTGLYSRAELSKAGPNFIVNDISKVPELVE